MERVAVGGEDSTAPEGGPLRFCDAHCHLQDPRIVAKADELMRKAAEVGVGLLGVCGTHPDDWEQVCRLRAASPPSVAVVAHIGVHPFRAAEVGLTAPKDEWLASLRAAMVADPTLALGECGLDRSPQGLARCDWATQLAVFDAQVALAAELDRPLAVHCVRAHSFVLDTLRRHRPSAGVLMHSFSGAPDSVRPLLPFNPFFSFSALVLNPAAKKARASVASVPLDRLLVETDSPDQRPRLDDPDAAGDENVLERRLDEGGEERVGAFARGGGGGGGGDAVGRPPARTREGGGTAEDEADAADAEGSCGCGARRDDLHLTRPPSSFSGKAFTPVYNEPALVVRVAEEVARIRGAAVADVASASVANFVRLFRRCLRR